MTTILIPRGEYIISRMVPGNPRAQCLKKSVIKSLAYYPNGKIKSIGRALGELKYGTWKYFNEEGKLINRRHFKKYTGSGTGQDCCDW
jgi:hypothetical protein